MLIHLTGLLMCIGAEFIGMSKTNNKKKINIKKTHAKPKSSFDFGRKKKMEIVTITDKYILTLCEFIFCLYSVHKQHTSEYIAERVNKVRVNKKLTKQQTTLRRTTVPLVSYICSNSSAAIIITPTDFIHIRIKLPTSCIKPYVV